MDASIKRMLEYCIIYYDPQGKECWFPLNDCTGYANIGTLETIFKEIDSTFSFSGKQKCGVAPRS